MTNDEWRGTRYEGRGTRYEGREEELELRMDWIAYVRREGPVLFETVVLSRGLITNYELRMTNDEWRRYEVRSTRAVRRKGRNDD
jgi:hypothetical protein